MFLFQSILLLLQSKTRNGHSVRKGEREREREWERERERNKKGETEFGRTEFII